MEEIPVHGEIQLSDMEGYSEDLNHRDIDHYNQIHDVSIKSMKF
jgi:hypothetical protein